MHGIFTEHNVVLASFVSCVVVFFLSRKKLIGFIDSHIQKAQDSLDSSEKMKLDALELLERSKKEYEDQVSKGKAAVENALKKQVLDIDAAKKMLQDSAQFQVQHAKSRMEKERLDQIENLDRSALSQAKSLLRRSMSSATNPSVEYEKLLEDIKNTTNH